MADDLANDWSKLKITEEEDVVIGGDDENINDKDSDTQISLLLVGKLLTQKPFNFEAMKRTLTNVWRVRDNIAIHKIELNLFAFQFFDVADKDRILEGSPWFFYNKPLALKEVEWDEQPSDVCITKLPFWIQLDDVPFSKRNINMAYEIGEAMEGFLEFDDSNPLGLDFVMRVKVLLDIDKPLRRWMKLATGHGGVKLAGIKYERLMDFCFNCGRLDHGGKECQHEIETDEVASDVIFQYGPYLRASPKKRSLIHKGVREKKKVLLANLKTKKNATTSGLQHGRSVVQGPSSTARKRLFSTRSTKVAPNVPSPVANLARQPRVLTVAPPCTLRPNEEFAHAVVKSSPGVDNVAESLASLATNSVAEVCKDSSLGKCPVVVNGQEHDVPINVNSNGKTWRRYNRGTIDDKGGSGNSDIVYMHVGDKRSINPNLCDFNDDVIMEDVEKKQRFTTTRNSGDKLNQVEGGGSDLALEKQ
ncbi:hypothetical protein RDABS01_012252 [Bienertia sinuspersici]